MSQHAIFVLQQAVQQIESAQQISN